MPRSLGLLIGLFTAACIASGAIAAPDFELQSDDAVEPDVVGGPRKSSRPSTSVADTVWIADWSFDTGSMCDASGWIRYDNRIKDSSNYWTVSTAFSDTFGIDGNAAILRQQSCVGWTGYADEWDYSIIAKYRRGTASDPVPTLAFDYLSDSEPNYDFVTVEADSAGASESRVNYGLAPGSGPNAYRTQLAVWDGVQHSSFVIGLPDFSVPSTTHKAYIRFVSGSGWSDEDGNYPSRWHAGLVIDNLVVRGALAYTEDFEGPIDPRVELVNSKSNVPFGEWSRLYAHLTDNDKCIENTTCAWAWMDPTLPADLPCDGCPGLGSVRNWLDNILVSPWVALPSDPARGTVLSFRRLGGSPFANTRIVQGWRVRTRARFENTESSAPGDSIDCVSGWKRTQYSSFNSSFTWSTVVGAMTQYVEGNATEIQVSFRTVDWRLVVEGDPPPSPLLRRPGPYLDRVRIGRQLPFPGPRFLFQESSNEPGRWQAQDCFPTFRNAIVPGEHYSPSTDRFGSAAFSRSRDISSGNFTTSPNVVTGDSITVQLSDESHTGVTSVAWHGAIVAGPHAGKAPAPYSVGANGFFAVTPDTMRFWWGPIVAGGFVIDLDDTYFRGGDVLLYFWSATDGAGGFSSLPEGLSGSPASVAAAEAATGGLLEVSFLPAINWSASYLARIAADAHGDLDPTPAEISDSHQRNCILYVQKVNLFRRSGDAQRTSFMYTLDQLGYRGAYDVYDHSGLNYANNHLGGRATVKQAEGYGVIIDDSGRQNLIELLPDGTQLSHNKVNQAQWYRDYLAAGAASDIGTAALWLLGESVAIHHATNPLVSADLGLASLVDDQGLTTNPEVRGLTPFTWANGGSSDFTTSQFALSGACPTIHRYDGASASGTAVVTHRYAVSSATGPGAIIANKNVALQWNTVWSGFGWFDIVDPANTAPKNRAADLARLVLQGVLPAGCQKSSNPTNVPPSIVDAPRLTALHANVPNPFNPVTMITFDLARPGRVRLEIFDVAGKKVRTLVDELRPAGYRQPVTWNGLDEAGRRVASGVYLYRLVSGEFTATRRLVVMK